MNVSIKATVRLECEFDFMIYWYLQVEVSLLNTASKRPILFLFIMHSDFLTQRSQREVHFQMRYSSSMNSTMTVPFFSPASAMGTSSISMRFLPMLMSSKFVFSLPSKGAALSHS